ncbi:hypothetical protein KBB25_04070 [Candidatus Gracilibacteria bacterium]|nr:hypothetical protein [Candidatus Gracilibacteria bacterium]
MKKIILAGFISIMSVPLMSFATESQTPRQFSASELVYIKNINCDTFTGNSKTYCLSIKAQAAAQSGNTGTTLPVNPNTPTYQTGSENPPPSGYERDHEKYIQTGAILPKPPTLTGSEENFRRLSEGIGKLSPADREALTKIIRDFLLSKGITIEAKKEMKKEIKEIRDTAKKELKDTREATKKEIEKKRDLLKESLKKKREALKSYKKESQINEEIGNK